MTVAADAPPGLRWLRLYDEDGATALRPFVIGSLPEIVEVEPNDGPATPHRLRRRFGHGEWPSFQGGRRGRFRGQR